jgi:HTH-type transcriptional regulator/antitoxin HigA
MKAKVIKTEAEYEAALAFIETLMDAEPGSPQEDELELFSMLVENYEKENYPIGLPDPVEAIKFRIEQEGLTRKDLVKYIGSQSKVSEVLNHKRPLSLAMIRSLVEGLGIPSEVLLQSPGRELEEKRYDHQDFPFKDMFRYGFFEGFGGTLLQAKEVYEELLEDLFSVFACVPPVRVRCKHGNQEVDRNALKAWQARALTLATREGIPPYLKNEFTEDFIREVVKLSYYSKGPQLVKELLNKKGIHFIILRHLPKTYLDGACFYAADDRPIIGMTLRHDRLDNFWFTLIHELAHLFLHLNEKDIAFFDDTDQPNEDPEDQEENEANVFTRDMLIPPEVWGQAADTLANGQNERYLVVVAERLKISLAVVAGRARWETNNFTLYNDLLGSHQVRGQFVETGNRYGQSRTSATEAI